MRFVVSFLCILGFIYTSTASTLSDQSSTDSSANPSMPLFTSLHDANGNAAQDTNDTPNDKPSIMGLDIFDIDTNNHTLQAPPAITQHPLALAQYFQLAKAPATYFLPAYYSFTPPYSTRALPTEVKFQLGVRVDFFKNILCKDCSFDFSHTQTHWFQFYNFRDSSPVRDINFNPSISFNYNRALALFGGHITALRISYNHLSNGERRNYVEVGEADRRNENLNPNDIDWFRRSKTINRFIAQASWQRGGLMIHMRAWVPRSRGFFAGIRWSNDILRYMGYGDIAFSYAYKHHLLELYANNVIGDYTDREFWDWKGRVELGYTYALHKNLGIYLQFLHGYGDSIYEYNYRVTRLGSGVRMNF